MGLELTSYIQAADDSKRSDSPVEHSALSEIVSLVLPYDKLARGRKTYKYVLTVVNIASRYKEAKPLARLPRLFSQFMSAFL